MISIACVYGDGSSEIVREGLANLQEATVEALKIADRYGRHTGTTPRPKLITIIEDEQVELSITVTDGGLTPPLGH